MGLHSPFDEDRALVSAELVCAASPSPGLSVVRVVMLKDGHGMTSHQAGPPKEIRPKKDDVLDISSDLAENWGSAGYCLPELLDEEIIPPVKDETLEALDSALEGQPGEETLTTKSAPTPKPPTAPTRGKRKTRKRR